MLKKVSINSESDRLSLSLSHELMLLLLTAGKRVVDSSMTGWSQLDDLLRTAARRKVTVSLEEWPQLRIVFRQTKQQCPKENLSQMSRGHADYRL